MTPRRGPWALLGGLVAYTLWGGPLGIVALTAATMIWIGVLKGARAAPPTSTVVAGLLGAAGIWWLLSTGDLSAQFIRAWTVFAVVTLVTMTWMFPGPFLPRALVASAVAALGTTAVHVLGTGTWVTIIADVERQLAEQWQFAATQAGLDASDMVEASERVVPALAAIFPAVLALQTVAGCALGSAFAHRLNSGALGRPLEGFSGFRFSDHLVWLVIVGMLGLVLPVGELGTIGASNLLVFGSGLYVVRGMAILGRVVRGTKMSPLVMAVVAVGAVILAFPVVLLVIGAWMIGVTDTWMDFRSRWTTQSPDAQ